MGWPLLGSIDVQTSSSRTGHKGVVSAGDKYPSLATNSLASGHMSLSLRMVSSTRLFHVGNWGLSRNLSQNFQTRSIHDLIL